MRLAKETILGWMALAGFFIAILLTASWAFAAPIAVPDGDTSLKVDLSEYATWAASAAFTIGMAIWASVKGLLPGPAKWLIEVTQIDQVIENSIRSWISQNTDKISAASSFTVDLRQVAVRDIVAMALNTGNKYVRANRSTLVDKVHARLEKYIRENFD